MSIKGSKLLKGKLVDVVYREDKHLIVMLPNSLKNDLINCDFNDFSIQIDDSSTGDSEIIKSLNSVSQVITYVNSFLEVQI